MPVTANVKTESKALTEWVEKVAQTTRPDQVRWCDGSDEENRDLIRTMQTDGTLIELNQDQWPGCYLHRSDVNDVARVEHCTFICTPHAEDAGPTNHWKSPEDTHALMDPLFAGCMKGRTMYVVPYLMGPVGGESSKFGVEITDSPYVVANMRIMTRMGQQALDHLGDGEEIVYGMHSIGELDPERRYICHLPEERLIMSYGSGYGGNALLGKKCFALRLASVMAREQGWLAEHMLILGIENPEGQITYIAAAFPSACGKTNLAMLVPPREFEDYKIWTVGDDIAWMRPDAEGRLWAINPEAGFFGVVPGTSTKTNLMAMASLRRNALFTNVALTPEGEPWWEGKDGDPPAHAIDWKGNPWTPESETVAAHPNSRFTAQASQCPCISSKWEDPAGVPISAIIFGGRRTHLTPLVYQATSWNHGAYVGATMTSETTAAATGAVGKIRRDPMAMLPFCGYNMADYWAHWIEMGAKHANMPEIFHVNWFRKDAEGRWLWPGFGDNLRVLLWIADRVHGRGAAVESPIGYLPAEGAIDANGLDVSPETMAQLLRVDREPWLEEMRGRTEFFEQFGDRLPDAIREEHEAQLKRLG